MTRKPFAATILTGLILLAQAGNAQQAKQMPSAPPAAPGLRTPETLKMPTISSPAIIRFLKQHDAAKSMSFTARSWSLRPQAPPVIKAGQTFDVVFQRPNRFAVHITRPDTEEDATRERRTITFKGVTALVSISDGTTQLELYSPFLGLVGYSHYPATKDYLEEHSGALSCLNCRLILNPGMLVDYVSAPDERIGLTPVAVFIRDVTLTDKPNAHVEDEVLYFAKDTGELMRWSYFEHEPNSQHIEFERVEYGDWKFNLRLPASTFSTKPPPGAIPAP